MAKELLQSLDSPVLAILNGPKKGTIMPLTGSKCTIGRSDDNDIVLPSESVSRNHADISCSCDGIVTIRDLSSKNGVLVNSHRIKDCALSDGDLIQVGDFLFRFEAPTACESPDDYGIEQAETPLPRTSHKMPARSNGRRIVLYAALFLFLAVVYWISSTDPKPAPHKPDAANNAPVPESADKAAAPPGTNDPLMSRAEQTMSTHDWSDGGIRQAEQYFRRGTREYLNRNYHRAIEAFQMALQIEKSHKSARQYLGWAVQEVEAEAKKHNEIAVRYFESLQYQRAIYHFREVITLMAHRPTDPMVGHAEKYIEVSKRALEAADFFP